MHYSQMMHLYNGNFNPNPNHQFPNNFPQTNQLNPPQNFSHSNVANFGSSSQPQQPFYGQTYPPNNQGINFQAFPGWSGPQQPQNRWPPQQEPKKDWSKPFLIVKNCTQVYLIKEIMSRVCWLIVCWSERTNSCSYSWWNLEGSSNTFSLAAKCCLLFS